MSGRRISPIPLIVALLGILWLVLPASAATADEETGSAPPPDTRADDPDEQEIAYTMLRPVNTLGWTFTGLGLTCLGVGLGASLDGIDVGPVPAVGRVLFVSSLFVTTITSSVALQMLPYRFRGRPARTVAAVAFAVGIASLVTESVLRLVFAATQEPMPFPLTVSLQAAGYGGLTVASLTTLIDNEVLMAQLAEEQQERADAKSARQVGLALIPAPIPGGAGALLMARW